MSLDLEKCSVEKHGEPGDREDSTCCTKIEYCMYLAIIMCLLFLITLQLFSPSLTILLITDPSLVVTVDNQQTSELSKSSHNAISQQNLHIYDLDSHKSHLIEAKFVNSSKEYVLKVDLTIERENTVPFLGWIGNLFGGLHL